ncbi:catalytic activity protein [Diaporthe eres]|nr:catalytic activity protein [Diaporthe eres]
MPPVRTFTRGRQSRGRGLRKTTGCLTCRRRHVKCDEKKPACGGCTRTKKSCVYGPTQSTEAREPSSTASRTGAQSSPPAVDTLTDPPTTREHEKSARVAEDHEVVPEPSWSRVEEHNGLPTATATASSNITASTTTPFEDGDAISPLSHINVSTQPTLLTPQPQVEHGTLCADTSTPKDRQSRASFSSSHANVDNATSIWVDLLLHDAALQADHPPNVDIGLEGIGLLDDSLVQSPSQFGNRSNGAYSVPEEVGQLPASSNPLLQERTTSVIAFEALEKNEWHSASPISSTSSEVVLFQHFVRKLSQWMHNVGLMNAIWALSSRHLSLSSQPNEAPLYDPNDALPYYYKTLRYVQKAMQYNTYKTSLELLATSLIVSTYEMLDGSSQDWERHLHGVFLIQRSQVIHGDSMGLRQGVWWAWLCQDVWAAYRERRRPFTFWKPVRTFRDLEPFDLAARSVYLFAQVVGYCSREYMEDGAMEPLARIARAAELRSMLEDWKTYLTAEFEPLPQPRSAEDAFEPIWIHPTAFAVAMQLYYCSHILLLLHQPMLGGPEVYAQQRRSLRECIDAVCGIAMTLTDFASSVMCSQCLFIAAANGLAGPLMI